MTKTQNGAERVNPLEVDPDPRPVFGHSIAWSLATPLAALALPTHAWGMAYAGSSRLWIGGLVVSAGGVTLSGVVYAGFLALRRTATGTRLALAPVAIVLNLLSLALVIAAAADLRW